LGAAIFGLLPVLHKAFILHLPLVLAVSLGLGSGRRCGVARIAEPVRSYDKLLLMVREAWEAVEADELLALVREMPVRCEAVIDAQGGYTKY
jgi:hypothetical protein